MIDQFSLDGTGWALFSDDMKMRYRLARSLRSASPLTLPVHPYAIPGPMASSTAVFLMLNPSTADAFKPDPTVTECRKRAIALGVEVLEVVNLFALRTPYPKDLARTPRGLRGEDETNDTAIIAACLGAHTVIAAWGNDGALDDRATYVMRLLAAQGVKLHHLGVTNSGAPKHPLARGKHRIPADLKPIPWDMPIARPDAETGASGDPHGCS